ncbi:hypothetical protein C8Q74DRAFT_233307 [Fomes fomentarius]|nr:hypothetical protein C8Q74DRAFT_233307 [Fomes fomentarius]
MASSSSNFFDFDSFFKRDDFEGIGIDTDRVLRSTIFILTTLIAGYRVSEPHPSPTNDQELQLWSNLSAILSTAVAGPVVAVTGIVTVEEEQLLIQSTLVAAYNDTIQLDAVGVRRDAGDRTSVEPLEPRRDDDVPNLMRYPKPLVSLKDHARDVCAIFNYFLRVPEEEPGAYIGSLTDFTIYRTRSLLSTRLKCGKSFWGHNPIRLIEAAWNRSGKNSAIVPSADPLDEWRGRKDALISVRNEYVVGVLKDAGIAPSNSTKDLTTFPFTASNGKQWARVLLDALERFEDGVKSFDVTVVDESGRKALVANIWNARCALLVIHEFVNSEVIAKLVTHNLAAELRKKYDMGVKKPNPSSKAGELFKKLSPSDSSNAAGNECCYVA